MSWMLMTGSLAMVAATLPVHWRLPAWGWRALFFTPGRAAAGRRVLIGLVRSCRRQTGRTLSALNLMIFGGILALQ